MKPDFSQINDWRLHNLHKEVQETIDDLMKHRSSLQYLGLDFSIDQIKKSLFIPEIQKELDKRKLKRKYEPYGRFHLCKRCKMLTDLNIYLGKIDEKTFEFYEAIWEKYGREHVLKHCDQCLSEMHCDEF